MKVKVDITNYGRESSSSMIECENEAIMGASLDIDLGKKPEKGTYDFDIKDRDNRLIYRVSLTLSASAECALRNGRLQPSLAFRPSGTGTSEFHVPQKFKSKEQKSRFRKLIKAFRFCESSGEVRLCDMAALIKVSTKTVKRHIREFPETLTCSNGVVTRVQEVKDDE